VLDFERSTLTENNLGNMGPDTASKRLLRFESVIAGVELPEDELPEGNTTMPIDLIVTNTSFYDPSNSAQNRVEKISCFAVLSRCFRGAFAGFAEVLCGLSWLSHHNSHPLHTIRIVLRTLTHCLHIA